MIGEILLFRKTVLSLPSGSGSTRALLGLLTHRHGMSSWEYQETPQSELQISLKNVSLNKNQSRKGYNRILTPLNASITIPGRNFTDAFVTQRGDGMEEFRRVFYGFK